MVVPGCGDHAGRIILVLPDGPPDHIAHAVDQPHGKCRPALQLDLRRFLRYELGLGSHDGPAGTALGQLIPGPFPAVDILDVGNDLRLHEPFDKGGFSGAYRSHHANVDIPRGAGGDILIDRGIHSIPSFFRSIFMFPLYVCRRQSMTARLFLFQFHKTSSNFFRSLSMFLHLHLQFTMVNY